MQVIITIRMCRTQLSIPGTFPRCNFWSKSLFNIEAWCAPKSKTSDLRHLFHSRGHHSGEKQKQEHLVSRLWTSNMSKLIARIPFCPPSIKQTQAEILIPPSLLEVTALVLGPANESEWFFFSFLCTGEKNCLSVFPCLSLTCLSQSVLGLSDADFHSSEGGKCRRLCWRSIIGFLWDAKKGVHL